MTAARTLAMVLALLGCLAVLATHLGALHASGLDPAASPIGALARGEHAVSIRNGLWLFALGHLALVPLLARPGAGRFTRGAQLFVLIDAALIAWLPLAFAAEPAAAFDAGAGVGPLWLLGGSVGLAMSGAAVALWRHHRPAAYLTLVCLLLWSLLAPLFLAVDPDWIGAYQRSVGLVLLLWTAALAVLRGRAGA